MYEIYLWIGLIILVAICIIELWNPKLINEGFANLVSVGDSVFWAKWLPRRGDVGVHPTDEQDGYIRDIRYFAGYTDIQRLGRDHDFCRMIQSVHDPDDTFFACALGGTEGLSTVKYRTPSTKDGFKLGRDDYMNEISNGRNGYCRILKTGKDQFEAKCNPSSDTSFTSALVTDSSPPEHIATLLMFYEGIIFWLRMKDDILDYAENLIVTKAGDIQIDEVPKETTEGLTFNGEDQFLRIGDSPDLSFGDTIQLRYMRAISCWVYFEEFTNNAKLFDFGDQNQPSVSCGIIGRGNPMMQQEVHSIQDESQKTIPNAPSGQQCTLEQSPETAMVTSSANIDRWDCPSPELFGRIMNPLQPTAVASGDAKSADLLYEIWDKKQRKLHIQVKNIFQVRKWTHLVITATSGDAFKPDINIYSNGKLVHTEKGGWLPQTNYTTKNYIGKSNMMDSTSQYDNKDELFKGKMFDVRGYRTPMTDKKIKETYKWGKKQLGLDESL